MGDRGSKDVTTSLARGPTSWPWSNVPFFLPSSRPWVWGCWRSILHLLHEWMIGCEVKYILLWTHGCSPPSFSNVFENSFPGLQFIFRLIRRRVSRVTEQANAKSRGICVCHSCCQHSVGGPRIRINILQRAGKKRSVSCSVVCDPLSSRLLCPWDSPGRNTGVGCHFLLQGIFLTQGSNLCVLSFLH